MELEKLISFIRIYTYMFVNIILYIIIIIILLLFYKIYISHIYIYYTMLYKDIMSLRI